MESVSIIKIYEEILQGKRKRFPRGTWDYENAAICIVQYLIEEKLKWTREDTCAKLDARVFKDAGLNGMLEVSFGGSPFAAIDTAYPGEYDPWEMSKVPQRFWTQENSIKAVKWLVEERLQWSRNDVCESLSSQTFRDAGLGGMLSLLFKNSPYDAVDTAYPKQYKPWELKCTPIHCWSHDTGIEATRWLIEEKLNWNDEDIRTKLGLSTFTNAGLLGMMKACFDFSPYNAIAAIYPGKYKQWELRSAPKSFWIQETGVEATKWLVEEKLGWTIDHARKNITRSVFKQYGLGGMLQACFENKAYKAIEAAYPE